MRGEKEGARGEGRGGVMVAGRRLGAALEANVKEAATVSERWSAAAVRRLLGGVKQSGHADAVSTSPELELSLQ